MSVLALDVERRLGDFALAAKFEVAGGGAVDVFTPRKARPKRNTASLQSPSGTPSSSSFAFSPEAQQMCTGDAFRLCSSEIPNIPKITACMYKHRSELSAGCRTVMDRDLAAQKAGKVSAN